MGTSTRKRLDRGEQHYFPEETMNQSDHEDRLIRPRDIEHGEDNLLAEAVAMAIAIAILATTAFFFGVRAPG